MLKKITVIMFSTLMLPFCVALAVAIASAKAIKKEVGAYIIIVRNPSILD